MEDVKRRRAGLCSVLLLAWGADLRVCGEPGPPCAPGELYRMGECHARTVKE